MKYLIVVDMQNDFTCGALGSDAACAIIPNVVKKVGTHSGRVIFTRDTHGADYLNTQEGKRLPVAHCIKGTPGHEICGELCRFISNAAAVVDKPTFGSTELPRVIEDFGDVVEEIELCGLCTDICVISNAMILKAAFPEARVLVDSSCCAGVTRESHENALAAMRSVQIDVI